MTAAISPAWLALWTTRVILPLALAGRTSPLSEYALNDTVHRLRLDIYGEERKLRV